MAYWREVPVVTELPTASAEWERRVLVYQPDAATFAEFVICCKNEIGAYEWRAAA